MATFTYNFVVLFILALVNQTLGFNESIVERRDRSFYFHPSLYYRDYIAPDFAQPQYNGVPYYFRTPNYFSSLYEYQQPFPIYSEDLGKRLSLNGFFSRPAPIRDLINQLILNQLVRVPGVKESTNAGDVCQASSGEYGTCLTRATCSRNGGQSGARCGFGTFCCTGISYTGCGGQISLNNTYWSSPRSLDGASECSAILKLNSNLFRQGDSICQVRLDFINFNLVKPTSGTKCDSSQFEVSGTSNNVPGVCGWNSGQHTSNEIKVNFKLDGNKRTSWRVRISMIPCWSSFLAPSDCLQYYTGPSGSFTSFYSQKVTLSRSLSSVSLSAPILSKTEEEDSPLVSEGLGDYLRRAYEIELATDAPITDPTPTSTTTPAPLKGDGYVYRKIKLGDADVKICFKKD